MRYNTSCSIQIFFSQLRERAPDMRIELPEPIHTPSFLCVLTERVESGTLYTRLFHERAA